MTTTFSKLSVATFRSIIAAEIRKAILDGRLQPGERLVERQLAAQFGSSLSAVREALVELEVEGYIVKRRNTATYVTRVTLEEAEKVFQFRAVLEPYAMAEAARRATDEDLLELGELHRRMRERAAANDFRGYLQADYEWHERAWRVDDAETGLVVDRRRIEELPSGRNPLALVHLAPNVNGTAPQVSWSSDLRINGGRSAQIEYLLNGVPITTGFHHNVPGAVPSMDAVAEIKVLTNGFSAEYGRLSGGVVTVVTRSGTNVFHGRLYNYFSTDRLNATPWNTNRLGGKKPPAHSHNFGANVGGPVVIPGLYKGRDRTFFFVDYETTRATSGGTLMLASTPTALERQGDFSQSLIDRGRAVQIFDPATGRREGARVVRDPFPGNRIPGSRINPVARRYMEYYPLPNREPLALSSSICGIPTIAGTGSPARVGVGTSCSSRWAASSSASRTG